MCDSCQLAKSHQLPYPISTNVSTVHLEQVLSDVWGPALVPIGKHSYYVSFIDDFSKFTWIYLLKKHSNVYQVLLNFQQLVSANLIEKLSVCKLIGVESMKNSIDSFKKLALHIMYLVLMHINRMAQLNASITILLRLALLCLPIPPCPSSSGVRHSLPLPSS